MNQKRIVQLLESNKTLFLAKNCLEDIGSKPNPIYKSTDAIPLQNVVEIYSRRAKMNTKSNEGIVLGYSELLESLRHTMKESVMIHIVLGQEYSFLVFTDESLSELFGILESPHSEEYKQKVYQ
jgi:hypothetical protein